MLVSVKIGFAHEARDGVLASRADAVKVRARVEREIGEQPAGAPIELDFSGVVAISVTFADECLGRLLSARLAGYDEDHPLFVTGANEEVRETIAAALRARRLQLLSFSDGVELLGGDDVQRQTIREAFDLEEFSANELASRLGLSSQAANNRLAHLVRVGALRREPVLPSRGGREFRYVAPHPPKKPVSRPAPRDRRAIGTSARR
jgi:STAS-like domain of unknown function (DUF4325)